VTWRSHPLFVRRRTPKEIAESRAVPVSALLDPLARNANLAEDAPATDQNRETKSEWLILVGVCTHFGMHANRIRRQLRGMALSLPRLAI